MKYLILITIILLNFNKFVYSELLVIPDNSITPKNEHSGSYIVNKDGTINANHKLESIGISPPKTSPSYQDYVNYMNHNYDIKNKPFSNSNPINNSPHNIFYPIGWARFNESVGI